MTTGSLLHMASDVSGSSERDFILLSDVSAVRAVTGSACSDLALTSRSELMVVELLTTPPAGDWAEGAVGVVKKACRVWAYCRSAGDVAARRRATTTRTCWGSSLRMATTSTWFRPSNRWPFTWKGRPLNTHISILHFLEYGHHLHVVQAHFLEYGHHLHMVQAQQPLAVYLERMAIQY